jgi:soluble P-type ATPase
MITVDIPGYKTLQLKHLVLDLNGTLAVDGVLVPGVGTCLQKLARDLKIYVVTADTFGQAHLLFEDLPCEVSVLAPGDQDLAKLEFVQKLGPEAAVCIGNGRNDKLMLKEAALGIAVILAEGGAVEALISADVACTGIVSALELLTNPLRLIATLRS